MKLKVLWPGKTRNEELERLQASYLEKINRLIPCKVIETKGARGIEEKFENRIKDLEASGLEKHLKDEYIICLLDKGKEMNSEQFAEFLAKLDASSARRIAFIVGGFLGLKERILKRADCLLSLSIMTFSHELSRLMLLEQIYRSLSILKGTQYAK